MQPFIRWGTAHWTVIALTVATPLILAWWARRGDAERRVAGAGKAVGSLLVAYLVTLYAWRWHGSALRWQDMVPLHVCDLAVFACAAACLTRNRFAFEIAYFWGLAGTSHGLLTPDLHYGFPAPEFWFFFLGHGGVIATVIFMLAAFRLRPSGRSAIRAYATMLAYAAVAGAFNAAFDTNYGFLCAKPFAPSVLDHLGPWPWYIGSLALLGILSFLVLYLPWAVAARPRGKAR